MRKKTAKVDRFIAGLHQFIISHPQFRKLTGQKSEVRIQAEIRPILIRYLEDYFEAAGYKDSIAKANKSFYWEGQEGRYGKERGLIFGTRNYPDFIITAPYLVAIEYKKSPNASLVKQLIGQSIIHTLSNEFDFVYCLFHDESTGKKIKKSTGNEAESRVISRMRDDFNLYPSGSSNPHCSALRPHKVVVHEGCPASDGGVRGTRQS